MLKCDHFCYTIQAILKADRVKEQRYVLNQKNFNKTFKSLLYSKRIRDNSEEFVAADKTRRNNLGPIVLFTRYEISNSV